MEIKMNEVLIPEKIGFNYDELKQELTEKVKLYETMVYTDENIKDAKNDRAELNRLKKALNDTRLSKEREYMKPFSEFKEKVNELIKIIDNPVQIIDAQIKEYEAQQKEAKRKEVIDLFNKMEHPDWLQIEQIWSDKWLNASTTMKTIETEINIELVAINNNLKMLEVLPEFSFEAIEIYKTTLDAFKAVNEANRMVEIAKKKKEQEQVTEIFQPEEPKVEEPKVEEPKVEEPKEEPKAEPIEKPKEKDWMHLEMYISDDDFEAFEKWAKERNIEWRMS